MGFWDDIGTGISDLFMGTTSKDKLKKGTVSTPTKFHPMPCTTCSGHAVITMEITNQVWLRLDCSGCGKAETISVD